MRRTAALIVGGGPAGAAAACLLARADRPHLLVERSTETGDALCGGFLSWRTLDRLATLGIAADALNPTRVTHARLFAGGREAHAALPFPALAVSRRRLDTLLLARATADGAAIERGVTVREIVDADCSPLPGESRGPVPPSGLDPGVRRGRELPREIRTADGATLTTGTLFLASGKHDVRGVARPGDARGEDPTIGLRIRLASSPALTRLVGDAIELHLFPGGYAGLVLQEDGSANLCMAVHRSRLHDAGSPASLLDRLGTELPALGERLASRDGMTQIDAIANVPYGWRVETGEPGLVRLGDQAACIPSLAGEGMGIALASGIAAATTYIRDGAAAMPAWQVAFAHRVRRPMQVAGALRATAESRAAPWLLPFTSPPLLQLMARMTRVTP